MANAINIPVVEQNLGYFATNASSMTKHFSEIESSFVLGMKSIWSTQLAADTVDGIVNAINDYIGQLNSKLPEAISNFVDGVNAMLIEQEQGTISAPEYTTIEQISRKWQPNPQIFNLPSSAAEVEELCTNEFTSNITLIKNKLEVMKMNAATAKDNGLAGGYVNAVVTSINSLIDSGTEVIDAYNSSAVENAVAADTLAQKEQER